MPRAALPSLAAGLLLPPCTYLCPSQAKQLRAPARPPRGPGSGCGLARTPHFSRCQSWVPARAGGHSWPPPGSSHWCSMCRPCARPAPPHSPVGLSTGQPEACLSSSAAALLEARGRQRREDTAAGNHGRNAEAPRGRRSALVGRGRAAVDSLTTVRRGSAPGVRDRARRSLRALPERVPAELSEPLSSEITIKSSMATGPAEPRASGERPQRLRLGVQLLKRLQRPRRRHRG